LIKNTFDAYDPGVTYCAQARFVDGALVLCRILPSIDGVRDCGVIDTCVVERVVTRGAHSNDNIKAQDLLDLAWASGIIAAQYPNRVMQRPPTVPKEIWHARVESYLNGNEIVLLPKLKTHRKHVLCAIGAGMKYLGRMQG
jgi:hypothetical protein